MNLIVKRFFGSYNHSIPPNAVYSKLSNLPVLSDKHGRFHNYLRMSLTERCNLRCVYCMPEEGIELTPKSQLLTTDQYINLARTFVKCGVDKIRLTGGEPSIYKDIKRVVRELGEMKSNGLKKLSMTSNGIVLHRYLDEFKESGLDSLNISLDTLVAPKFELFARRPGFNQVMKSIDKAIYLNYKLKVNTVMMNGKNDDELLNFVEWVKDKPINIRFIEYMPFDNNKWQYSKMFTYKDMMNKIEEKYGKLIRCDDHYNETAKNYTLNGFVGSVSFITSMTDNFCGGCNRIRMLSTGQLKWCLFDPKMVSLKEYMSESGVLNTEDEERLIEVISENIKNKHRKHGGYEKISKTKNLEMIRMGG